MERVLPLVAKYGAAVVAISNDETGISMDPDVRFEVAKKIVERAADYGIPASDVVVDPLVMPIGALGQAGQQAFNLIRRLRERAQGQHHLRCLERQLRAAQPARRHRHVPGDGDRRRHDVGDHEPAPPRGEVSGAGRRRAGGHRQELRGVDPRQPRPERARRRGWPRRSRRAGVAEADVTRRTMARASDRLHAVGPDRHGRRTAPRCSTRRAGSASTSTRCAAAAASAVAARSCPATGRSPSGRSTVDARRARRRRRRSRPTTDGNRPLVAGSPARLRGARSAATSWSTCPPASQVHRQVVRKDLDLPPITVDPSFTLVLRRGAEARARQPGDDRHGRSRDRPRVAEQHGVDAPTLRLRRAARRCTGARPPSGAVTVAVDEARRVVADLARLRRHRATASPSTSARRRSPATCATSRPARCSPPPGG